MADHRLSQISTASSNNSKRGKSYIGPWQLGRTLGSGSSGRVRLAKHSETGQLAAVKIVAKSQFASQKPGHRKTPESYGIEREVIIMKLIEHPNVMALYDVWENKGELYLVLEYVEGGELFDYLISRGKLSESEAIHYFRQICFGVDYCHKFNICHRDLKPENLLLDKHRNIKIADFGMAALESDERLLETSCGSPHYASPEIVTGRTYHGAPSDIWSCGIILFALLTGHLPFDDDNIRHLLMKVQSGKYRMPHSLSLEARDLISRMLVVDPSKRITMPEILRHPLLRKHPSSKVPLENLSKSTARLNVSQPVTKIDKDILRNLQTLWHHDPRETLIAKLQSPEPNVEKTFYALLMKFRKKHGGNERNILPRNKSVNSLKSLNSSRSIKSFASNKSINQRPASIRSALSGRSNISLRSKRMTQRRSPQKNRHEQRRLSVNTEDAIQTNAFADMLERAFNPSLTTARANNEVRAISNPNPVTNNETVSSSLATYTPQKRIISAPAPNIGPGYTSAFGNTSIRSRDRERDRERERYASMADDKDKNREKQVENIVPPNAPKIGSTSSSNNISTRSSDEKSYLLPMIFEEERFEDQIRDEIIDKVEVISEDVVGYHKSKEPVAAPRREAPKPPASSGSALTGPNLNGSSSSAFTGPKMSSPALESPVSPLLDGPPPHLELPNLGGSADLVSQAPTGPMSSTETFETFKSAPTDFIGMFYQSDSSKTTRETTSDASTGRRTPSGPRPQRKPVPIYIDDPDSYNPNAKSAPTTPSAAKHPLQPINPANQPAKPAAKTSSDPYEQLIVPKNNRQIEASRELKSRTLKQPPKEKSNWIRRLTPSLNPRKASKPTSPVTDTTKLEANKENAPASPTSNEEPRQNWVMKLFSSASHAQTKVMYATQPTFTLRTVLIDTFRKWTKYGLAIHNDKTRTKPFTVTILPSNSLRLSSAKIEVQIVRKTPVLSAIKLIYRKGSRNSYQTFANEVESRLREMKVIL